jgi:hypothetical protein
MVVSEGLFAICAGLTLATMMLIVERLANG